MLRSSWIVVLPALLFAAWLLGTRPAVAAGPPTETPPPKVLIEFKTLLGRFYDGASASNVIAAWDGCCCFKVVDAPESMNCFLGLPCSILPIAIRRDEIPEWSITFGGPDEIRQYGQCPTTSFFAQIEAMLELFTPMPATRAHEIIRSLDHAPIYYRGCKHENLIEFTEGKAGLTYARDEEFSGKGREVLKIFCWESKRN